MSAICPLKVSGIFLWFPSLSLVFCSLNTVVLWGGLNLVMIAGHVFVSGHAFYVAFMSRKRPPWVRSYPIAEIRDVYTAAQVALVRVMLKRHRNGSIVSGHWKRVTRLLFFNKFLIPVFTFCPQNEGPTIWIVRGLRCVHQKSGHSFPWDFFIIMVGKFGWTPLSFFKWTVENFLFGPPGYFQNYCWEISVGPPQFFQNHLWKI